MPLNTIASAPAPAPMPPEAAFFLGLILGVIATLLIQAYGRRKAKVAQTSSAIDTQRAVELLSQENERQADRTLRLQERLAVLERIAVDPATHTAREIEALR
ncbi:hypothetical protein [Sphingomonas prati]|uniref:Uncharacterized protein n=1 Tax=Sphingomonas prati TaxID=1843237 RepID=A0A7W9F1J9_9SPHN|nr:hypothetical protein [Sphingomonas prati]MBB5729393.1 hypothetical protein [Sphingomonas prati]GGE77766.1 hypothetical protein GCM10011404_08110 [Sphingomonas prati]